MRKLIILYLLLMLSAASFAQKDRQYIREGNRLYRQKQYEKAENQFRKAVAMNPGSAIAQYNLGCALMMQGKDSLAARQYETAGKIETDKHRKSMAYHNLGVVLQNHQQYEPAIEAYKESLRNNPTDHETRYNLALCQKMLKNQPPQNQQNKQNQQDKQQDNQQKPQNQEQKPQNDQQDTPQEQPEQKQNQMSKENAEQLLNAAMQDEKATKEKIDKAMQAPRKRQLDKNW